MNLRRLVVCVLILYGTECAAKPPHLIDRFQDDEKLDVFIQKLEEKTSRFTSNEFLTSLEQKQQSFEQKKDAWNQQPLYIFRNPFSQNYSVGIYANDLFKIGFLGLDVAYDWYFYQSLKSYITEKIYKALTANKRPQEIELEIYKDSLCTAVSSAIQPSYKELQNPAFVILITKLTLAQVILSYAKHQLLINNQESTSWIEILTRKLTNSQTHQSKPIPIFDIIDEYVLTQFAINNSQGGIIESINQLFNSFGFIPSFIKHSMIQQVEILTTNILFISWFNYYIITPMINNYIQTNFEHLESLLTDTSNIKEHLYTGGCRLTQTDDRLNNFEKKSKEAIKNSINQKLTITFGTWLTLKNTTLARWKLYRNMIVSLPGWYRIINGAYGIYKKITIP